MVECAELTCPEDALSVVPVAVPGFTPRYSVPYPGEPATTLLVPVCGDHKQAAKVAAKRLMEG